MNLHVHRRACQDDLIQRSYANEKKFRYLTRKCWKHFSADGHFGIPRIYTYVNYHNWLTFYCAGLARILYRLISPHWYLSEKTIKGQVSLKETYR